VGGELSKNKSSIGLIGAAVAEQKIFWFELMEDLKVEVGNNLKI